MGTLKRCGSSFVSVITYYENKALDKNDEKQIKEDIIKIIEGRGKAVDKKLFDVIETGFASTPQLHHLASLGIG